MKKWIFGFIGLGIVIAGLFAISMTINRETSATSAHNTRRQSQLYRGIETPPRYSKSYIDDTSSTYTFKPVLQGDIVAHDFMIKNNTPEPMVLHQPKGCCGIMVTSYPRRIESGREGKLSILMVTDKYGGRGIEGDLTVETSGQNPSQLTIHVSLPVIEFARISPHKIILKGSYGNPLHGTSVITPAADYPFRIIGIKPKKGIDIRYEWQETVRNNTRQYVVTVTNTRRRAGIYRDILFIQTDHKQRPELKIRVEGYISE